MSSVVRFKDFSERFGLYEGVHVPLEQPMLEEEELNKPKRNSGDGKKYVYTLRILRLEMLKKYSLEIRKVGYQLI